MNETQLLDTILASTYVKADVLRRIRIVREYLEQRFFTPGEKKDLSEFLAGQNVTASEKEIVTGWGAEFFKSFTKENTYDYLEHMNARVKDLPTVNMYVPIGLDSGQTAKIGQWVRGNIDKEALVEFHVDFSAFGGCTFAWNGVYYDYSLHHYVHKKVDAIRKVLDGYV
jgi:F0F1-type ATP synthase delta subunit